MKVLVIGARIVGHQCLEALHRDGVNVVGVLHLDESKAGITTAFRSFDALIEEIDCPSRRFRDVNEESHRAWVEELSPDLGVVVGVSQLIREPLLSIPPQGVLGMHPTFLPEGRGRAPIPWALIRDLPRTGVSIFKCVPQADEGPVFLQERVPIYYEDNASDLGMRTDEVAARLLCRCVHQFENGDATEITQDPTAATDWPRRRPEDGLIDWQRGRRELYNWVRALTHPYPGAFTEHRGHRLFIWRARESFDERRGRPGEILARLPQGLLVATGEEPLLVQRVQLDDAPEIDAAELPSEVGELLGAT